MNRLGRVLSLALAFPLVVVVARPALATTATPGLCDPEPSNTPRPYWPEVAPTLGSGYPDYQNITTNLQIINSIQLLASVVTRAAEKLGNLQSDLDQPKEPGQCICCLTNACPGNLPEIYSNVTRDDCQPSDCTVLETTGYPLWLPTDVYKNPDSTARFLLKEIGFLDDILQIIQDAKNALTTAGSDLDNFASLLSDYADYVDKLTEGFHLGGYSTERPDLHLCVGYGGHKAFAEMANLFGVVTIGGRYTSHNLSAEHRSQFRSGGFGCTAWGKSISILPGIEGNIQIDGFKWWDVNKPFGIDLGLAGDGTCTGGAGFRISDFEKYDIFHLVDSQSDLTPFDTNNDGCLQPGEFLITSFYPVDYTSASDGMSYVWPRASFPYDWEKQSTAVFSAGLNLPLEATPIVKFIPPTGIVLFPGATLFPKLTLKAGVEWTHKAFGLRDRLQDAINTHLPASSQLDADDFQRPMHYLQAPDVTEDNGTNAHVDPGIGANLVVGIPIKNIITIGITASVGLNVQVKPAGYGGLEDMNIGLANALLDSNPPQDQPCDPIVETGTETTCTNTGVDGSTGTYDCSVTEIVVGTCKGGANDGEDCSLDSECPGGKCELKYGCEAHGTCTTVDPGDDGIQGTDDDVETVTQDATEASCTGDMACAAAAINAGAACEDHDDCIGPFVCDSGPNVNKPCASNADCPGSTPGTNGICFQQVVACEAVDPVGYFTPYTCLETVTSNITGWQGPGCHPLDVGFPSACGCSTDADCVAGQETCVDGFCNVGGTPVVCTCDPTGCPTGRVCVEGACMLDCTANGTADCAAFETCTSGHCVNQFGIPFTEQILWNMAHGPKPRHSVATYALSDITTSAILDAGIKMGLDLKIFKKVKHFDIFDFKNSWILAAFMKSWYQPGLEAQYQNDCDPVSGNTVTNWQPGSLFVDRYNPASATTGTYGNAGTLTQLEQWCSAELPVNVEDPPAPTSGDVSGGITDVQQWGEDIAVDLWAQANLCIGGKPLTQYFADLNASPSSLMCEYTFNSQTYTFPCGDLNTEMLLVWGCLSTSMSPVLANHFNGTNDPLDITTTFNSQPVFDLSQILIDPNGEFDQSNIKPQILGYQFGSGYFWYQAVQNCFDQNYATVQPGDVHISLPVGPCCGDGVLETQGCAQGPGIPPCEQCDDGNTVAGDGCSPTCQLECSTPPLGVCGNGIVDHEDLEECDDGNAVNGDGCDRNCTKSRCGNGVVAPGEECDDGNTVNGDGCDDTCKREGTPVDTVDPVKCQQAVVTASAKLALGELKALQKCEDAKLAAKLPPATVCSAETKTAGSIAKARTKIAAKIASACGGKDKACGTADDDVTTVGWNVATCPNLESGFCGNAIDDCGDVAQCLRCVDEAAVDQSIALLYDGLKGGPGTPASLLKCERAIGAETAKFFAAKLNAIRKCWANRLKGLHANACPIPGDQKTAELIAKAELKKVQAICKACGGGDGRCDGTVTLSFPSPLGGTVAGSGGHDDVTPAAVGFTGVCPDVTIPGGANCCKPVQTLADLVTCVDCVAEYKADCVGYAAVPGLAPYPVECTLPP